MASKYYFLNILIGILIITSTAFSIGMLLFRFGHDLLAYLLCLFLFFEVLVFVKRLNKINRKIASFLLAVQNNDTSIVLPKNKNASSIQEIYTSLNNIVQVFQNMKIESEFREQLFIEMIEHSSTGFISIDKQGNFEIMNHTARKLLGVNYTSNLDRIKNDIPEFYRIISKLKAGEVDSCEIKSNEVTTTIQISLSKLKFRDKELQLISLLNITKELESREIESWQKLIRIMNHEIMNSMAPIISVSKSLLPIYSKNSIPIEPKKLTKKKINDTINGLEIIETMSSGLNNFVSNYRKLAQIPKPEKKTIVVKKWTENIVRICNDLVQVNNIEFFVKIAPDTASFNADEALFNQVVVNLIKNAIEAPLKEGKKHITLRIKNAIDKTVIEVINNGEAIKQENLDKIFIPFFSTKEKGVGIGLFISKQIINAHKGTLSVYSAQNENTIFRISI